MNEKINVENPDFLGNSIVYFKDVISEEICKYILDETTSRVEFKKSLTGTMESKVQSNYRTSEEIRISGDPRLQHVDSILFDVFDASIKKYVQLWHKDFDNKDIFKIEHDAGYQLLKYEKGGCYKLHADRGSSKPDKVNNLSKRMVSSVLYLNDDFEGGETNFPLQSAKVTPKLGSIVFFPSSYAYPHESLTIKEGVKYAIVSWFG